MIKKFSLGGYNPIQMALLLVLLVSLLFLNIASALHNSPHWDERCYIGAGDYMLTTGNDKYNAYFNPPLSYYLNSLFLFPLNFPEEAYSTNNCHISGNTMMFASSYDSQTVIFLARLPFIFLSLALSLYVLAFAYRLYGPASSLLALFLYTFSTTVLAFSSVATTDFTLTFCLVATLFHYHQYSKSGNRFHLVLTGVFFGLAQLSKMSAVLLIPTLTILAFWPLQEALRSRRVILTKIKPLLLIFILGSVVVWAGYGFQFGTLQSVMPQHYVDRAYEEFDSRLAHTPLYPLVLGTFENVPLPAPSYFFSFAHQSFYSSKGRSVYFAGEILDGTPWYYPFASFLFKTPVSLIILIALTIFFYRKINRNDPEMEAYLIVPILLFFIFFMLNNLTSGIRHLLPVFPFIFILTSQLLNYIPPQNNGKHWKLFLGILCVHYMVSMALVSPNPLSYFTELGGGPSQGHKYLVGANIDAGQALPSLKRYLDEKDIRKINLSYFGSVDPVQYGINYDYMPAPHFQPWDPYYQGFEPPTGVEDDCSERTGDIAISVTNYRNVHLKNKSCYEWLRAHQAQIIIEGGILVYHIPAGRDLT